MKRYLKIIAAIVAVSVGAWVVYTLLTLAVDQRSIAKKYDNSREERKDLRSALVEQQTKTDLLAAQVKSLGETPVVRGAEEPLPPDLRYVPVPGKTGKQGERGKTGKSATFSQVMQAVVQMIDDAIARNCGGSCKSTVEGPEGKAGPQGEPGRGIKATYCNRAGLIVTVYDDKANTRQVMPNSRCRGVTLPNLPDDTGAP